MSVQLIIRLLREVGRCGRKQANHASWVTSVIFTDRPNKVSYRCVIEDFCDVINVRLL